MELTDEGFLVNPEQWSPKVAQILADNFILNNEHLYILKLLRDFYFTFNVIPNTRAFIKYIKNRTNSKTTDNIYLNKIFDGFNIKKIAKFAGLPKPNNCF